MTRARFASFAAYAEDVTRRHWEAFGAELQADPYSEDRARLKARTMRLSRLRRACAARLEVGA